MHSRLDRLHLLMGDDEYQLPSTVDTHYFEQIRQSRGT
jgi:hypothetical protein